jgi:hypothetical protein
MYMIFIFIYYFDLKFLFTVYFCRNLSLGLVTNVKACKVASQEEAWEWRKVWGNEPSHSQESFHFGHMEFVDSQIFKEQL